MDTPPRTPTLARMSASSIEANAYLLSPQLRQSGSRLSGTLQMNSTTRATAMLGGESPFSPGTPDRPLQDRFIPDRDSGGRGAEVSRFLLEAKENASPLTPAAYNDFGSPIKSEPYANLLTRTLFDDEAPSVVLPFHRTTAGPLSESSRFAQSRAMIYQENRQRLFSSKTFRVIPQTPERILDAPELIDDYYLNLIDWSARNVLAVALCQTLYLWDAQSGSIKQLVSSDNRENIITGVSWNQDGGTLAVGMQDTQVATFDAETHTRVRSYRDHTGRVGALSWNGNLLATGSRDSTIRLYDVRQPNCITTYEGHTQEVCGLRWSPSGHQLASGGNDNLLNVWDFNRQSLECLPTLVVTQHRTAVKAIAWNPTQSGILASGGGTADKTLKFWNVKSGELINSVDTRSQVCGAMWNHAGTEIVTSHGYSDNQLTIWKFPSLRKVTDLTGHSSRVLHLGMSPDGHTVVSAAGDETIRFWKCFADPSENQRGSLSPSTPNGAQRGDSGQRRPRPLETEFELYALR